MLLSTEERNPEGEKNRGKYQHLMAQTANKTSTSAMVVVHRHDWGFSTGESPAGRRNIYKPWLTVNHISMKPAVIAWTCLLVPTTGKARKLLLMTMSHGWKQYEQARIKIVRLIISYPVEQEKKLGPDTRFPAQETSTPGSGSCRPLCTSYMPAVPELSNAKQLRNNSVLNEMSVKTAEHFWR